MRNAPKLAVEKRLLRTLGSYWTKLCRPFGTQTCRAEGPGATFKSKGRLEALR